ncbi:MAG: acyl-CoA thioesterase [Alphaproteobacteria bacterium]|nr:acyl-CoA thioesterase [Alphaproteobacteria bacterium]
MKPEPFRLIRASYPYFRRVIARFSDMDAEGHLNNVALASFYEDARVSFLRDLAGEERGNAFRFVIASIRISYLAEAHYPGDYDVALGVTRFGNSSFDIGCGLFIGATCVGVCDTTQVTIGETGPITIPPVLRVALEKKPLARRLT